MSATGGSRGERWVVWLGMVGYDFVVMWLVENWCEGVEEVRELRPKKRINIAGGNAHLDPSAAEALPAAVKGRR